MDEVFWKSVTEYGILAALLWFFVWQNQKQMEATKKETSEREEKLSKRINQVEEYVRNELSTMVHDVTQCLTVNAEVIEKNTEVMERLENHLMKLKD